MAKIFLSYRRGGVRARTYRLADRLKQRFGGDSVFLDIESIGPGSRFADVIREAILSSSCVLIMIGPKWLDMKDEDGRRRLEAEDDHLRLEIETAIQSPATVIPVLVNGAKMPPRSTLPESIRELADLNAYSLADSHWDYDVDRLLEHIGPPALPDEKLIPQAWISIAIILFVFFGLADGENDSDVWLGAGAFATSAAALAAWTLVKKKPGKPLNRLLCVAGIIVGTLLAAGSLVQSALLLP
ncbi:MAG: toll/interleukin-1 receptor domain-containing protein [Pseudomonadota bacterium]